MYIRSNMKRIDWEKNTTSDAAQQKGIFSPTYFDDAKKQETTRYYYRKDELKNKRERYHVRAEIDLSG